MPLPNALKAKLPGFLLVTQALVAPGLLHAQVPGTPNRQDDTRPTSLRPGPFNPRPKPPPRPPGVALEESEKYRLEAYHRSLEERRRETGDADSSDRGEARQAEPQQ